MTTEPITASVHIKAAPARVFEHFTRPEAIVLWLGEHAVLNPVSGGEFSVDIRGVSVRGRYVEVDPPHRLVISWGHAGSDRLPPGSSLLEVRFADTGGGTLVTITHGGLPDPEAARHRAGWDLFLGLLAEHLEKPMEQTVVPPMSGRAWQVRAGSLVRIVDTEGGQTGDLFAVAADDLADGLSNGRTFDYGGTIRLTTGSVLYSRRSRPLLKIVEDEVGTHDFLYAPCSQEMFEIQYGATTPRPNCLANLTTALAEFGVPAATITTAFNFFMNVEVDAAGRLDVRPPICTAGQGITFVAERDVLVAVTSCAAITCNDGAAKPLRVEITAR